MQSRQSSQTLVLSWAGGVGGLDVAALLFFFHCRQTNPLKVTSPSGCFDSRATPLPPLPVLECFYIINQ